MKFKLLNKLFNIILLLVSLLIFSCGFGLVNYNPLTIAESLTYQTNIYFINLDQNNSFKTLIITSYSELENSITNYKINYDLSNNDRFNNQYFISKSLAILLMNNRGNLYIGAELNDDFIYHIYTTDKVDGYLINFCFTVEIDNKKINGNVKDLNFIFDYKATTIEEYNSLSDFEDIMRF